MCLPARTFGAVLVISLAALLLAPYADSSSGAQAAADYDALITQGNALLEAGNANQALNSGEAAIKIRPDRWEGYGLAGRALMNLKRYEDAADALSKAIDRAPESNQPALRERRRQCLLAESGYPAVADTSVPATAGETGIVHAEVQLENERKRSAAKLTWIDPATGLMWARYGRPAEYAHANYARASNYCTALRSLGYADWRLPTAAEFMRIYHFAAESGTVQLDGELATNKEILRYLGFWTSTPGNKEGEHVLVFEGQSVSNRDNEGEGRVGGWAAGHPWNGALVCVRDQKAAEHR